MNSQPIIIHKHWFGLFLIYLVGLGSAALVLAGLYFLAANGILVIPLFLAGAALLILILIITFIQAYVYRLSQITITNTELTILNYYSLFYSVESRCPWNEIEDVNVTKGNIFSQVLDFAHLVVETAGTRPNINMSMTPNPEHWRDYIANKAETTPDLVKNS